MRKRHLTVCESCGCVPCDCNPNQNEDHFDNDNYNPWSPVDRDEPTIDELMATTRAAA